MREMKDSRIPFCKIIPASWNEIPNRYIFQNHSKKVGDKASEYQLLSLTTSGVKEKDINSGGGKVPESYDNYQTVEIGDMIFCLFDLDVSAVFSGLSSLNGMITSAYDVFGVNHDYANTHFMEYWFQYVFSNRYYKMFSKNIRYTITGEMFKSLYTPIPSLSEQERIGTLLDGLSNKVNALIANQEQQIEKLKAYKQSLITEAVTKGLNPDVPMKPSGVEWIGDIPAHWNLIKANRIITQTQNGLSRRDLQESSGQIVLKLKNISAGGNIDYSYINRIELTKEELNKYILNEGDFLFVRVNGSRDLVGKCALFIDISEPVAYNDHIIRVRLNTLIEQRFFQLYLLSSVGRKEIDLKTSTAAGQFTISGEGLRTINVILPSTKEQKQIVEYLDERCAKIDRLIEIKQQKIDKLNYYKKSLIYEYVTGKKEA